MEECAFRQQRVSGVVVVERKLENSRRMGKWVGSWE